LSRSECAVFVELVLTEIMDCLERGETVKLSSFGSFAVRKKGQRICRNPKTGIEVPISPRRVMVFKASEICNQRRRLRRDAGPTVSGEGCRIMRHGIEARQGRNRPWRVRFTRARPRRETLVADLSILTQLASVPPDVIEAAADHLVPGVGDAPGFPEEMRAGHEGFDSQKQL
jgi:integration host factor subunit alpha